MTFSWNEFTGRKKGMKKLSLNGAWTLDIPDTAFCSVPAQVPGSVYHDLLCAKLIPDPFYRDNETEALKLMEHDFVYTRAPLRQKHLCSPATPFFCAAKGSTLWQRSFSTGFLSAVRTTCTGYGNSM